MVVTAHFISQYWKYVDLVLRFDKMVANHTGFNINAVFVRVLRDWKINNIGTTSKILSELSDGCGEW